MVADEFADAGDNRFIGLLLHLLGVQEAAVFQVDDGREEHHWRREDPIGVTRRGHFSEIEAVDEPSVKRQLYELDDGFKQKKLFQNAVRGRQSIRQTF